MGSAVAGGPLQQLLGAGTMVCILVTAYKVARPLLRSLPWNLQEPLYTGVLPARPPNPLLPLLKRSLFVTA